MNKGNATQENRSMPDYEEICKNLEKQNAEWIAMYNDLCKKYKECEFQLTVLKDAVVKHYIDEV